MQRGLFKAIRYFGSQKGLAKLLEVRQQAISHWLNRQSSIPYHQAIKIVYATKGYVTAEELAPGNSLNHVISELVKALNGNEELKKTPGLMTTANTNLASGSSLEENHTRRKTFREITKKLSLNHAKVFTRFWEEIADRRMKLLGSDSLIIFLYVQTCRYANLIGVYHLPLLYIANDTGLKEKKIQEVLQNLKQLSFCTYDYEREYIWVHEMALDQIAEKLNENDKQIKDINILFHSLPPLLFLDDFYQFYKERFFLLPRKFDRT